MRLHPDSDRRRLRAGSVVLPLHHPMRVAEEWSMVDNLSHGRAALSIASGWHFNDFSLAPENFEQRHQIMRDNITTLKKLVTQKIRLKYLVLP